MQVGLTSQKPKKGNCTKQKHNLRFRILGYWKPQGDHDMEDCPFCQMVAGKKDISSEKVYEDNDVLCFLNANPINFGHVLVIPKRHYPNLFELPLEQLQACIAVCQKISRAIHLGLNAAGLNLVQNNLSAAGQAVDHVHFHLIPRFEEDGFVTSWSEPENDYHPGQKQELITKIQARF
jgi:histidine triad (HIT) family protein